MTRRSKIISACLTVDWLRMRLGKILVKVVECGLWDPSEVLRVQALRQVFRAWGALVPVRRGKRTTALAKEWHQQITEERRKRKEKKRREKQERAERAARKRGFQENIFEMRTTSTSRFGAYS